MMARWDKQVREEHQVLRVEVEDLGMTLALGDGDVDPVIHRAALAWLTHTLGGALRVHLRREEEILFPTLERLLGRDAWAVTVLKSQHQELRAALRQMGELLDGPPLQCRDAVEHVGQLLVDLVEDHERKTDRLLMDVLEFTLEEPELEALGRAYGAPAVSVSAA